VRGGLDRPMLLPLQVALGSLSIREAATALGAQVGDALKHDRSVAIGASTARTDCVQAFWDGWCAGVMPGRAPRAPGRSDCVLAGVAAGALAVGQAFLAEQGDQRAGKLAHEISLWSPHLADARDPGPEQKLCRLAQEFWLVGLGNLGQAYLWSLSMLPYPRGEDVLLFLQDDDIVRRENWGTSILVQRGHYGALKTQAAEEWAIRRKFRARRIDRRLDEHLRRTQREPAIALVGLDRMPARRLLGRPGFEYVVDAGLGATAADYRKLRVNVFDSTGDPARHFDGVEDHNEGDVERLVQMPAYQELVSASGDECGVADLAGRSVAVPFVSAFVGALAVAQTVRIAGGEAHHAAIVGDLGDARSMRATLGQAATRLKIPNVQAAG
jgi:hypothetical protein